MKSWLLALVLLFTPIAYAQSNVAGLLCASNFATWTVPQGNQGLTSWSSPSQCTVTSGGTTFRAFAVGVPVTLNDAEVPANTEVVTPVEVGNNGFGCSISVPMTHPHKSFYFTTATAGLGEALSFAGTQPYQIVLTPDWQRLGGTTGMITAAVGNSNVSISDQRTATIEPYIWNGSVYVQTPFSGGNGQVGAAQTVVENSSNSLAIPTAQSPLTPGSAVLPAQALRIPNIQVQMPTTGWTAYYADGDSITAGSDSTATGNRYVNLIDTAVGSPTLTNNGVAGSFGCDVTNRVFNDENPGATSTTLQTIMDGVNDAVNGPGPGTYEPVFNLCQLATLSWLAIPSSLKTTANSLLPATNWTSDTTYSQISGAQATTYNATLTFPYTTTVAGQQVFVWYRIINGGTGMFGIADSGGAPNQSVTNFTSPAVTAQSYTQSVGVAILYNKTRAAGTYSVTINVNSINSGTVSILGIGVSPPSITSTTPAVWVGGVTRLIGDWQQASTTAYDHDVQADVQLLNSYGLAVYYVNTPNYFMSVAGQDMSGNQGTAGTTNCAQDSAGYWIHPCNTGHQEIANAFLAPTANPNYQPAVQYGQPTIYQKPVSLNQILATQNNPGTSVWFDDKYSALGTQAVAINGASVSATSCSANSGMTLDGNHPGLIEVVSGATSSEGVVCLTNNNGVQTLTGLQTPWRPWYYESQVQFPVLPGTTAHAYQVGLTNSAAVNPWTSSEAFYLSSANANANHFYCEYNSGPTLVDSGVSAVANTWYKLTITDDGQILRFFINGTQVCGTAIAAANATAGNTFIAASSVALTGTSEYMIQDYELFQISGLNR
jgi:Concanavalin A-like lectin/glucanases superfamily